MKTISKDDGKLLKIVNTVLSNRGKRRISKLSQKTHLRDDIGFDSLDLADFTVRVEAQFGVDVFASGLVGTVGEVLAKINKESKTGK